jgi:hypothetical protein
VKQRDLELLCVSQFTVCRIVKLDGFQYTH